MIDKFKWKPCPSPLNRPDELSKAITALLKDQTPGICPLCSQASLRFYYHEFETNERLKALMNKKYLRRGTIWIWCPSCGYWTHISGVNLPDNLIYEDTLSDEDFKRIEGIFLIESLNILWEKYQLCRTFRN
jgi:hypothetical protein